MFTKKQKIGRSNEDKVKAIKRINERRAEIARAVKKNQLPKIYLKRYDESILAAVKDPKLLTKTGNISHGSKAVGALSTNDLKGLLNRETAAEAKQTARRQYEEEQKQYKDTYWDEYDEETEEPEEAEYTYDDYLNDVNAVNEALEDNYAETYDAFAASFKGTHGKKTYRTLNAALQGAEIPAGVPLSVEETYFT